VSSGKRRTAKVDPTVPLRDLEGVAARLSIPVRYEKGDMRGGLCRLKEALQIIINADLSDEEKTDVLAESLAQTNLDAVYVPPRVRELLEQSRNQMP